MFQNLCLSLASTVCLFSFDFEIFLILGMLFSVVYGIFSVLVLLSSSGSYINLVTCYYTDETVVRTLFIYIHTPQCQSQHTVSWGRTTVFLYSFWLLSQRLCLSGLSSLSLCMYRAVSSCRFSVFFLFCFRSEYHTIDILSCDLRQSGIYREQRKQTQWLTTSSFLES